MIAAAVLYAARIEAAFGIFPMAWITDFLGITTIARDVRTIRESIRLLESRVMSTFEQLNATIAAEKAEVSAKLDQLKTQLADVKAKLEAALADDDADIESVLAEQAAQITQSIALVQGILEPEVVTEPIEPEPEPEPEPIEEQPTELL